MQTLFDFSEPAALAGWSNVDDVVMGGRSQSRITHVETPTGSAARFSGTVSLEQGGGFASVRARDLALDLSGCTGLRLRVRGDGKRYGVTLRSGGGSWGLRFQAMFEAPPGDDWFVIELPFAAFSPKVWGMTLPLAPTLKRGRITSVGLIISDKQAGPFALDIAEIGAYTA